MTDRPILFSAPLVRALLDGRKTQTRRLAWSGWKDCDDQPSETQEDWECRGRDIRVEAGQVTGWRAPSPWVAAKPGDRLWVRETWCPDASGTLPTSCLYRADGEHAVLDDGDGFAVTNRDGSERSPWRSPACMPRWASRLTLTVTDVRVQRLFDISEDDARAEGCWTEDAISITSLREQVRLEAVHPTMIFRLLWNSLHGPDAWAANPWVVALTFTVARRNIDAERDAA